MICSFGAADGRQGAEPEQLRARSTSPTHYALEHAGSLSGVLNIFAVEDGCCIIQQRPSCRGIQRTDTLQMPSGSADCLAAPVAHAALPHVTCSACSDIKQPLAFGLAHEAPADSPSTLQLQLQLQLLHTVCAVCSLTSCAHACCVSPVSSVFPSFLYCLQSPCIAAAQLAATWQMLSHLLQHSSTRSSAASSGDHTRSMAWTHTTTGKPLIPCECLRTVVPVVSSPPFIR